MKFIAFQEKETFENEELIQQKWISRARSCKLKDWRCNKPKNIVGGYFRETLKSRETATCIAKFRKKMKRMVEKRSYFWADLGLWCNEKEIYVSRLFASKIFRRGTGDARKPTAQTSKYTSVVLTRTILLREWSCDKNLVSLFLIIIRLNYVQTPKFNLQ